MAVYQPDPGYKDATLSEATTKELEATLGFPLRFMLAFDRDGNVRSFIPLHTKSVTGGLPITFSSNASLDLAQSINYVVYKEASGEVPLTTLGWWGWIGDKWVCRYYTPI